MNSAMSPAAGPIDSSKDVALGGGAVRLQTSEGSRQIALDDLPAVLAGLSDPNGPVIWVHAPLETPVIQALDDMGLHEIVVKSLRDGPERPRVEEFADHVYISVFAPDPLVELECSKPGEPLSAAAASAVALPRFRELRLFLGPRWLISVGSLGESDHGELAERMRRQVFARDRGPSFIAYHICEWLVEGLQPLLDCLDDRIDSLEDQVVLSIGETTIQDLFGLKRELGEVRRRVSPLRDVMQRLGAHGVLFVAPEAEVYFRDVHDDVMRAIELLDTQRDILSSALDLHLSSVSMRLNRVMKQLTVVATIFMPLSFIVGLFGTNFVSMPFGSRVWLGIMFLLLAFSVVVMMVYTRRRT